MTFGEKLRAFRHQAGLTMEDIHIRTGYSISHIHQVETGKKQDSFHFIKTMAPIMGETPVKLLVEFGYLTEEEAQL